jgi:hypothetical protein
VSWIPSYARYSLGMPPRSGCAGDAGVCDKADGDIVVCGGALNIKNPCISTYYCKLLHLHCMSRPPDLACACSELLLPPRGPSDELACLTIDRLADLRY